ncbi:MAG: hypothetical protein ABJA64_01895 [Candidatus Saccharibacteria bacterium]
MSERVILHELFKADFDLGSALYRTAVLGYAFSSNVFEGGVLEALEQEADELNLKVGDHMSTPINEGAPNEVRQRHARGYYTIDDNSVPVANNVTRLLARAVQSYSNSYPELARWHPTEAGYQRYRNSDDSISAHRDRSSDQLLAATINVTGSTTVEIFETKGSNPMDYSQKNIKLTDSFTTSPGSLMLLRAPGFDLTDMLQTLHAVPPPTDGSRLVLNLRMRPTILENPK